MFERLSRLGIRTSSLRETELSSRLGKWEPGDTRQRWEPYELAASAFDSHQDLCDTRVFLFTQPRTASFTFCRYLYAAGWGVPLEYYGPRLLETLPPRLLNRQMGTTTTARNLRDYRVALEKTRGRNRIFSTKVMWGQYSRIRKSFYDCQNLFDKSIKIYLLRKDFASQVVSFWLQQKTGVYSFSDIDRDPDIHVFRSGEALEQEVCKSADFLIGTESRWLTEFTHNNWDPIFISSEEFLRNPNITMKRISDATGIYFDNEAVSKCEEFERNGRYRAQLQMKVELTEKFRDVLRSYSERRDYQLQKYLPQAQIAHPF